jgi:hypothetical protein
VTPGSSSFRGRKVKVGSHAYSPPPLGDIKVLSNPLGMHALEVVTAFCNAGCSDCWSVYSWIGTSTRVPLTSQLD